MKTIQVLGIGCPNCAHTIKLIEDVARARGVEIELEKVQDIQKIMAYRIMATPGVVVDGQVVHTGGIPTRAAVERWLESAGR